MSNIIGYRPTALMDLKRGTKFRIAADQGKDNENPVLTPIACPEYDTEIVYTFHHIDGMYSLITFQDEGGETQTTHFKAWTVVDTVEQDEPVNNCVMDWEETDAVVQEEKP